MQQKVIGVHFSDFSESMSWGESQPQSGLTSACIDVQRVTGEANRLPKPLGSLLTAACEIACGLPVNKTQWSDNKVRHGEDEGR